MKRLKNLLPVCSMAVLDKLKKFLFFSCAALSVTNIWILTFNYLLLFLNFKYPPILSEQFYRPAAAWPEPFEMPLYLGLTLLFVLLIWQLPKRLKPVKITFYWLVICFIFLLFVFLSKLGNFPMANEFYPYSLRRDGSIYLLILSLYLGLIGFILIQSTILEKIFKGKALFTAFFFLFIAFIIALFTFEPGFPVSSHEYGYFFGPLWEVVKGKTLFTQIHTDYGFYSTLFFTVLYKLNLFNFQQLPVFVWLLFIFQYFLSFYLIYKISRSVGLALTGLFSIITVNYFSFFVLPITITQYSAMRRFPSVLLLFLLFKFKKFDSRLLLAVTLVDFWIVDVGISIFLAVGFTLFILTLVKIINLKLLVRLSFILLLFQAGIFISLNLIHQAFAYKPINLLDIFNSLRQHAGSGLTMLPIDYHNYFWLVMLFYFASIIYFFRNSIKSGGLSTDGRETADRIRFKNTFLLFSANLSLFNALYFVGRSHAANLFDISILVILNFFILIACIWQDAGSSKIKIFVGLLLFILFIIVPAYLRRFTLSEFILDKYKRFTYGNIFVPETGKLLNREFGQETELINKNFPENEILILSREETYLLILTNKKNLLDVNPQSGIDTVSEMAFALKRASEKCPKKIAVDCRVFKNCPDYESYSQKSLFMAPYILDSLEKNCGVKYRPTVCTNKLCIAEIK